MPMVGRMNSDGGRPTGLMPNSGGTRTASSQASPAQVKIRFNASANHGAQPDTKWYFCQKVSLVLLPSILPAWAFMICIAP